LIDGLGGGFGEQELFCGGAGRIGDPVGGASEHRYAADEWHRERCSQQAPRLCVFSAHRFSRFVARVYAAIEKPEASEGRVEREIGGAA
jgi:hypothetical protein